MEQWQLAITPMSPSTSYWIPPHRQLPFAIDPVLPRVSASPRLIDARGDVLEY